MPLSPNRLKAFLDYQSNSVSRFPHPSRAIDQLRKNGPPLAAAVDVFSLDNRIQEASQSIISLSYHTEKDVHSTSFKMWPRWEPYIARWVTFFLRAVLASVHIPQVETDHAPLDHIVYAIPHIFDTEDKVPSSMTAKQGAAPYLQPLISQVWIFLVDMEHPCITPWTSLLISLT
ncbi:hypothetical protein PM082_024117 [Marasmius tenuissimus]|nr:hypothetical protein PM082_024117 [Marasmius tenuissimus]